jgi:acyl-CoA thioester hydrolase
MTQSSQTNRQTESPAPEHTIQIRVQYHQTDAQGRVHHAEYLNYFEQARVELLRSLGHSYRELESTGYRLVVTRMEVDYFQPAEFDDVLSLRCIAEYSRGARVIHRYELSQLETGVAVVAGRSVIACIGADNRACRLPDYMQISKRGSQA